MQTARWLPFKDYLTGDKILAPGNGGVLQALRIRHITLTRTSRGVVGGNLILNDRLGDQDVRLARKVAALAAR